MGIEWRHLEQDRRIETEGATLRCIYTPGHAEDHFGFLLEEENALLSGDHVLGHGTTFVTDMYDYMGTLVSMLDLQPTRLYPGHGPYIADGVGLLSRYLGHRQARLEQICQSLVTFRGRPFSASELARKLYLDTPEQNMENAVDNVERILRQLVREGRLAMLTGDPSTGPLTPMSPPSSYKVWKLPPGIIFREVEFDDIQVTALHANSVAASSSRL